MYKYCNLMFLKSQSLKSRHTDGFLLNTCIYAHTSHANIWILVRNHLTELCWHVIPEVVLPLCNGAPQTEPKQPSSNLLDKGITDSPYSLLQAAAQREKEEQPGLCSGPMSCPWSRTMRWSHQKMLCRSPRARAARGHAQDWSRSINTGLQPASFGCSSQFVYH